MKKDTKEQAGYTPKAAKHDERCALCRYYQAPHRQCARVKGDIAPVGWCRHFEREGRAG